MLGRLLAYAQYLVPRYALTALVYRVARIRNEAIKDFLIRNFVRLYKIDTADVAAPVPEGFETFNAFFIRELHAHARPIDEDPSSIVSPVDGTVSQAGQLEGNGILQAKGINYPVEDLLAIDVAEAQRYRDGLFATIYLAPYNYHRVHAPIDGELVAMHYVPGELFSVNTATASIIPGLFHRNERLILHFDTAGGPAAVILVGALNVGSISTPWTGELRPRKSGTVETIEPGDANRTVARGDLLGWFNMGSTVIVLLPKDAGRWRDDLAAGQALRMGETVGRTSRPGE